MKLIFEERTFVGDLASLNDVPVYVLTYAYWCSTHHWLVLEASADSPQLEDPISQMSDWPQRETIVVRQGNRFDAIRTAVDASTAWRDEVRDWLKEVAAVTPHAEQASPDVTASPEPSVDERAREALDYGKRLAANWFNRRGNPTELTLNLVDVECALANAYAAGGRAAFLAVDSVPPTQPPGGCT